jgi:hypothetical protein
LELFETIYRTPDDCFTISGAGARNGNTEVPVFLLKAEQG